jgi:uncharacterized protein with GYD domain
MPKYVMLTTLTAKGVQTLQATPDRLKEVNRTSRSSARRCFSSGGMIGAYDFLNIVEGSRTRRTSRRSRSRWAPGGAQGCRRSS